MELSFILFRSLFYLSSFAGGNNNIINHPTAIILSVTPINTTCQKANGKIIVQASGGVAPYDYTITGPFAPQPNGVFFNLPAGTYTVTATDAVFATSSQTVTLSNTFTSPTPLIIGGSPPSGCNTFDATLVLGGSGGLPPYTYSVDNINYQASNTFSNLTAGVYRYAIKDANGCSSFPSQLIYSRSISTSINCPISTAGFNASVSCDPFIINQLNLTGASGGTPPYTYSKDGINYQTSYSFNNLTDGLNTFWIKDAAGLILLYSVSLMDDCPSPFLISSIVQQAQCGKNGTITVVASNGFPPYQYSLDGVNFQTNNQFTGLASGLYTITVKDAYNLIAVRLANVLNNCAVVVATITNSTCGYSNGKIEAQAFNGTAPYQFSLDGINYTSNNVFTNLLSGNYTVYTKDASGGIGTANVIVSNVEGLQITTVNTTASGCDNSSGIINVTASNGTTPFLYSINGTVFQNTSLFTGLAPGIYTVFVKDANSCIDTKPGTVGASNNLPVVNLGPDTVLCEDQTLLLNATNTNATYLWQDGNTQATYLVTQEGNYIVSVDKAGCEMKDTIIVGYQLKPGFTLGEDKKLCLGNSFILKPTINNGVSLQGLNYLWQNGSVNPTYTVTGEGIYRLEVSNVCGFTSDEITITKGVCELYIPNAFTPNGDTKNELFKAGYGDNVIEFQLLVYNRYGQLVFKTSDKNRGWDGKVNGKPQQAGTYAWMIRYRIATSSLWQEMQGTVILLR